MSSTSPGNISSDLPYERCQLEMIKSLAGCLPNPFDLLRHAFGFGVMPITLAAAAIGIARGALDALADLAGAKTPRAGGGTLLRDQPVAQHRLGVAEAELRASRALLLETVRDEWQRCIAMAR